MPSRRRQWASKYDAMPDEIEQQRATIEELEAALENATAMVEAQPEAAGKGTASAKLWTEKYADLEESHLALQRPSPSAARRNYGL